VVVKASWMGTMEGWRMAVQDSIAENADWWMRR